jgi:hypothetical protein
MAKFVVTDELAADRILVERIATDSWSVPTIPGLLYRGRVTDIYQIAKNCRTSVEMIEPFYAAHLKNTLDAAAINVKKPKKSRKKDSLK